MSWKDNLPKRVPEYYRGETPLDSYLETCGEVFDELSNTIKNIDDYKDYKKIPEARLALLAQRYAFNAPSDISEESLRGIMRDITTIYQTRGVEASVAWVFRLLKWDVSIKKAWLLKPELYDPKIKELFPSFYLADGFESVEGTPPNYTENVYFIPTTDAGKIDYRNFVYGDSYVDPTGRGVYFNGRGFFDTTDTVTETRIVGETYPVDGEIRKPEVVLSTPYIIIELAGQTAEQYLPPGYTEDEGFRFIQGMLEYLLRDLMRPSNVKILLLVSRTDEENHITLDEEFTQSSTSEPHEFDANSEITVVNTENTVYNGAVPRIGDPELRIGMPNYLPVNSMTGYQTFQIGWETAPIDMGESVPGHNTFLYSDVDVTFYDDGGTWKSELFVLRTPSRVVITTPGGESINIEGKKTPDSPWESVLTGVNGTGVAYKSYDLHYMRFSSPTEPVGQFDISVEWEDQTTTPAPHAYLVPEV